MAEKIDWLKKSKFKEGRIDIDGRRHLIADGSVLYNTREMMRKTIGQADRLIYEGAKKHVRAFVKNKIKKSAAAKLIKKFGWGKKKIASELIRIIT